MGQEKISYKEAWQIVKDIRAGKTKSSLFPSTPSIKSFEALEGQFPLCFVHKKRLKERQAIWKQVEGLGKSLTGHCCSALYAFTRLLIIEQAYNKALSMLISKNRKTKEELIEAQSSLYNYTIFSGSHIAYDDSSLLDNRLEALTAQLKPFERTCQLNRLPILLQLHNALMEPYQDCSIQEVQQFNEMGNGMLSTFFFAKVERHLLEHYSNRNLTPIQGAPPLVMFSALLSTIYWLLAEIPKDKVTLTRIQELTASLVNEYCYHNPIFKFASKQSQKTIKKLGELTIEGSKPLNTAFMEILEEKLIRRLA